MSVQVPRRLFTVAEFHQMADAGIFTGDDRVELLAGEIVQMAPIGSRHASCVDRLNRILSWRLGEEYIVRVQNPAQLDDYSEPQPDVTVVKARPDFYRDVHPGPSDVLLVIEVADTSAESDRAEKVPLYGRAGIPEVRVVDLGGQMVDVYREPGAHGYRQHLRVGSGDQLVSSSVPGLALPAADL